MKALYAASALFLSVIIFLSVNFFIVNRFLNETEKYLLSIPKKVDILENMNDDEIEKLRGKLLKIKDKWDTMESYICASLDHKTGREFMGEFISALSFFESGEYPEFLSQIEASEDTLEHIRYDEGIRLGNIM